jgi:tetratricopeptide (TPR) repeat protein
MKKTGLLVTFVLFALLRVSGEPLDLYTAEAFEQLTETLYNCSPRSEIERDLQRCLSLLEEAGPDDPASLIVRAHALTLTGKHFIVEEYCLDPEYGKSLLARAEALAGEAKIGAPQLQAHAAAVQAEIAGSYFLTNRAAHLFSYGLSSSNLIDEALEADADSPYVQLMLANRYIHTPRLFGGNSRKADEVLDSLSGELSRMPVFLQFTWYQLKGLAARQMKKEREALSWFSRALELYPGNLYTAELISGS